MDVPVSMDAQGKGHPTAGMASIPVSANRPHPKCPDFAALPVPVGTVVTVRSSRVAYPAGRLPSAIIVYPLGGGSQASSHISGTRVAPLSLPCHL